MRRDHGNKSSVPSVSFVHGGPVVTQSAALLVQSSAVVHGNVLELEANASTSN